MFYLQNIDYISCKQFLYFKIIIIKRVYRLAYVPIIEIKVNYTF